MGLFETLLHEGEQERHFGILRALPRRRGDVTLGGGEEGYLAPREAAAVMRCDEEELLVMVARGELVHRYEQGDLIVRPAIVRRH